MPLDELLPLDPHLVGFSRELSRMTAIWDAPYHVALTFCYWCVRNFVRLEEFGHSTFLATCATILRLSIFTAALLGDRERWLLERGLVAILLRCLQKSKSSSVLPRPSRHPHAGLGDASL